MGNFFLSLSHCGMQWMSKGGHLVGKTIGEKKEAERQNEREGRKKEEKGIKIEQIV